MARLSSGRSMLSLSSRYSGARHAAAEDARIEAGTARHDQHVAVARIDRDHCTAATEQAVLGRLLRGEIEAQHHVGAGPRRPRTQLGLERAEPLHRAALRIDEDLAEPVRAVQLRLACRLDTELADQRRAGVRRRVDAFQVRLADRADIAERMHAELAFGIEAGETRADVDAGETVTVARRTARSRPRTCAGGSARPRSRVLE